MANSGKTLGSIHEFDSNWRQRKEASYNHWIRGKTQNQIQLAFRYHWRLFQELMQGQHYRYCLEVGCGRGSISSYFADNGLRCTLLDSSANALDTARRIFAANGHKAHFVHGDALDMPFEDNSFDVVVSIGLLEHFKDIQKPIYEQVRVLKPGGIFLGYIVPQRPQNVQHYFNWINTLLGFIAQTSARGKKPLAQKTEIYRSDFGPQRYLPVIKLLPIKDIWVKGVYPLPMLSHSPEFPFSLLPSQVEKVLTRIFEAVLLLRKHIYKRNPWICNEKVGQAFLLVFKREK